MSSTKFVLFKQIGKTRWPPWPLICQDIFDIFSETADEKSTKLDRKQDLNVLFQVCVFRADQKTGIWLAETFSTSPLKPLNGIEWNLSGRKISTSSDKFVFFEPIRKKQMATLASDWLMHFWLLLWNGCREFKQYLTVGLRDTVKHLFFVWPYFSRANDLGYILETLFSRLNFSCTIIHLQEISTKILFLHLYGLANKPQNKVLTNIKVFHSTSRLTQEVEIKCGF